MIPVLLHIFSYPALNDVFRGYLQLNLAQVYQEPRAELEARLDYKYATTAASTLKPSAD